MSRCPGFPGRDPRGQGGPQSRHGRHSRNFAALCPEVWAQRKADHGRKADGPSLSL